MLDPRLPGLEAEVASVDDAYTVVLVDKWGHVLERDGTAYRMDSGHRHFEERFADLASARAFCEAVVRELPHVECDVSHGGQVVLRHFDEDWHRREGEDQRRWFAEERGRDRVRLAVLAGVVLVVGAIVVWRI